MACYYYTYMQYAASSLQAQEPLPRQVCSTTTTGTRALQTAADSTSTPIPLLHLLLLLHERHHLLLLLLYHCRRRMLLLLLLVRILQLLLLLPFAHTHTRRHLLHPCCCW